MRAVLLAAALAAGTLQAQVVEVRVVEDSTRRPVAGAIVRLVGPQGPVAQGLSDVGGRIVLTAPGPGTYRLRADRIGHSGIGSLPFELVARETIRREVIMPVDPVLLPALVVTGATTCARDPAGGTLAGAVWDEVRKALTATDLTARQDLEQLRVILSTRRLTSWGSVLEETVDAVRHVRGQPFRTVAPGDLARTGFVTADGDSLAYAAPDAAILLHQDFVRTHCFRSVPADRAPVGYVGLAFEPVPGRRVPDIAGTLWVDRETRELRRIEYRYTRLPFDVASSDAGGLVEFQRLPHGTWIVSDWHIRMPLVLAQRHAPGRPDVMPPPEVTGYLERGGMARAVAQGAPIVLTGGLDPPARLTGRAFDSVAGAPLAGAIVRVAGVSDSAVTRPDGTFHLGVTRGGERMVTVRHPRLSLIRDGSTQSLRFETGAAVPVEVAVPPVTAFAAAFCGEGSTQSGIVGQVFAPDGQPVPGVMIRVDWVLAVDLGVARGQFERAISGARGLYTLCDLPPGRTLTVRLMQGQRVLDTRHVTLERGGFRWVDLGRPGPGAGTRVVVDPDLDPPAVLTGRVYDSVAGGPLRGAVIRVEGQADSAVTHADGTFSLDVVQGGARLVTVQHRRLGLLPDASRQTVTFAAGSRASVAVAVPSITAFSQAHCPPESWDAGIIGQVLGRGGVPREGVPVEVRWQSEALGPDMIRLRQFQTKSGAHGLFVFCDVPPRTTVSVAVVEPDRAIRMSSPVTVGNRFVWVDLRG